MKIVCNVWQVAREYAGLAAAGGMNKVIRGLSRALVVEGCAVTAVIPYYGFLKKNPLPLCDTGISFFVEFKVDGMHIRHQVKVLSLELDGVRVFLLDSPPFSEKKDVYVYTKEEEESCLHCQKGNGHHDFDVMNSLLQHSTLIIPMILEEKPDIIHCHDGHTAFLPALLKHHPDYKEYYTHTKSLVTIHNAGAGYHQEIYTIQRAEILTGLSPSILEKGRMGEAIDPFLLSGKTGVLSTVSPGYAREILHEKGEGLTGGLGKALRCQNICITGIYNGLDIDEYDPSVPNTYYPDVFTPGMNDQGLKMKVRRLLVEDLKKDSPDFEVFGSLDPENKGPLFTGMSRITGQKGINSLLHSARIILEENPDAGFLFMGQGETSYEADFKKLAGDIKGKRVLFINGFNNKIEKLLFASGDFFLIPSLYEPCGLADLIAMLVGNIPLVHATGGLKKIISGFNGFSYKKESTVELTKTMNKAIHTYRNYPERLKNLRYNGYKTVIDHFSWKDVVLDSYLPFYQRMMSEHLHNSKNKG